MEELEERLIWFNEHRSGDWHKLTRINSSALDLASELISGVYVMWLMAPGDVESVVHVGSATNVGNRLDQHENSEEFGEIADSVYVTWANVSEDIMQRVEKYLGDYYNPPNSIFPDVEPLKVNPPFQRPFEPS